jgi:hypothetical protein
MNDDLRPDALDDELGRRFRAGADVDRDPDVVLDALRPRMRRARSQRRASIAGACAGVAAVVVALVLALGSGGGGNGSVQTPPASRGPDRGTTAPSPTTTAPSGAVGTPDATTPTAPDASNPTTSTPDEPTTAPPATAPPPTAPTVQDFPYSSAGGSIVVRLSGGALSLLSSSPAGGYTAEVHDSGPSRVEVRFSDGSTEWRIRVDLVDGQPQPEITSH